MDQKQIIKPEPRLQGLQEDQQSEWSLSSLQQLKGLDLNSLKCEEQGEDIKDNQFQLMIGIDKDKSKIQAKYPPFQEINSSSNLYYVGLVSQRVGELFIIQANSPVNLVDIDNWLFDESKKCVGFVIDIFGRVDHPYYAIKHLKQIQNPENYIGKNLYYADGCKTLTQEDIKSMKEQKFQGQHLSESSESDQQSSEQFRSQAFVRQREVPRKRRSSFQQVPYNSNRDRTRQKHHHKKYQNNYQKNDGRARNFNNHNNNREYQRRNNREHNQTYLQNTYKMYYNQMMQLYNGQNGMPLPIPPVFPPFQSNLPQQSMFQHQNQMQPQQNNFPQVQSHPSFNAPIFTLPNNPQFLPQSYPHSQNQNQNP